MARLETLIRRVFQRAWTRFGRPQMIAVKPMSAWSLPAGFAFESSTEAVLNPVDRQIPMSDFYLYWGLEYIDIVPTRLNEQEVILMAVGEVPAGTIWVGILGDDYDKVVNSYAVQIDGEWYDVVGRPRVPAGTGTIWSVIQLQRRS